jgi:selenide, water dikinase
VCHRHHGFGLLGHLHKLARASGGTRRNLDWVTPHVDLGGCGEAEVLLLADAQTSGGLLVAGEIPGAPVVGELVPRGEHTVVVHGVSAHPYT